MKGKLVWLLLPCLMVIALVMPSCGGNSTLEVAQKFSAAMNDLFATGNVNALDEIADPDIVVHTAGMPDMGLEEYTMFNAQCREIFPNYHSEVLDIVASGDTAAIRHNMNWTFSEEIPMPGFPPPNGVEVSGQCATFLRVKDGKVVEVFTIPDSLTPWQQIGLVPLLPYQQQPPESS